MLDKIREKKSSLMSWLLVIIIIVVFIAFFGPGSFRKTKKGCGVTAYAARVDGHPITIEDFNFTYQGKRRELTQRMGGKLDRDTEKSLNLKQLALDELIDLQLLANLTEEYGLSISDSELNKYIMNNPSFQSNGQFDFNLYNKLVRYQFQISLKKFEDMQRTRLGAIQFLGILRNALKTSDEELWLEYSVKNNKAGLEFVAFDPSIIKAGVKVSDADVENAIKNSKPELATYFKAHERDYSTPKAVKARHILIKVSMKASEKELAAAKIKAEKIITDLNGGASFDDLAKKYSEDPSSKDKGGELGWFEGGRMVREFEEAAFTMGKGETSQIPVKTAFGYHIIRVEDIREPVMVTFEAIEKRVARDMLTAQKANTTAKGKADAALAAIKSGAKLEKLYPPESKDASGKKNASSQTTINASETGLFAKSANGYVPHIGLSPEIMSDAFAASMAKPNLPKVYETGGKYIVASLKERIVPDQASFVKDRDAFEKQTLNAMQMTFITDLIKNLKSKAKIEINSDLVSYDAELERERRPEEY